MFTMIYGNISYVMYRRRITLVSYVRLSAGFIDIGYSETIFHLTVLAMDASLMKIWREIIIYHESLIIICLY